MGESITPRAPLRFDRRVRSELRGATITSDAGLPRVGRCTGTDGDGGGVSWLLHITTTLHKSAIS